MSDEVDAMEQVELADEVEALFVQSAAGMAYENSRLTRTEIAPATLLFSESCCETRR